jgi:hypothetical protein
VINNHLLSSPINKKNQVNENDNDSTSQNMQDEYKIKYNELKQKYDNQRVLAN